MIVYLIEQFPEWARWVFFASATIFFIRAIGHKGILKVILAGLIAGPLSVGVMAVDAFVMADWRGKFLSAAAISAVVGYLLIRFIRSEMASRLFGTVLGLADYLLPIFTSLTCAYMTTYYLRSDWIVIGILLFSTLFFCWVMTRYRLARQEGAFSEHLTARPKTTNVIFIITFSMLFLATGHHIYVESGIQTPDFADRSRPSEQASNIIETTKIGDVSKNSNLRELPTIKSSIIGNIPKNSQVTILGITEDGNWYRVSVSNYEGFIHSSLIKLWD